jgi:hypothetical protein
LDPTRAGSAADSDVRDDAYYQELQETVLRPGTRSRFFGTSDRALRAAVKKLKDGRSQDPSQQHITESVAPIVVHADPADLADAFAEFLREKDPGSGSSEDR